MYDRSWARSTVETYQKLRTRAQQIDLCLQQLYLQDTGRELLRIDIQSLLIDSVQGKTTSALWTSYKKLVRRSPLDKDLLRKFYGEMKFKVDVEILQRQFDFS